MICKIEDYDGNLAVETDLPEKDIVFRDVRSEPFSVYGLYDYKSGPSFRRLPADTAAQVGKMVSGLSMHTAGGRVRFSTDSTYIAIKAALPSVTFMQHMPLTGSSGFDLYIDGEGQSRYLRSFVPPTNMTDGYESLIYIPGSGMKNFTVNFPLYNAVDTLYIGLKPGSSLLPGLSYRHEKPVVYYGSSITQGGCASRPGNSYEAIISRMCDCDHQNLGFSGNAKGEEVMAEYIAGLDASVFVCDYDHNAPSVTHLEQTHERFFKIIRAKRPDLPVVFVSRPDFDNYPEESVKRRDMIYRTFINAFSGGDRNVYFIDGRSLFGSANRDACTVDACHPNDAGFVRMAEVIGEVVARLL